MLFSFFAVRSFGTEDREVEKYIPPRDEQFEFIVFRGQDIKDLHVCEVPQQQSAHAKSQLPQDPAIVQVQVCIYCLNIRVRKEMGKI